MGTYDEMTAEDLRDELRDRGLPVSGTKPELLARLEADDREAADRDADASVEGNGAPGATDYLSDKTAVERATAETRDAEPEKGKRGKKAERHPMLAKDNTVDADALFAFTGDVRALADELSERLDTEITERIDGLERDIDDPRSGVLLAGKQRLLGAVTDVKRQLQGLHAAAAALSQDTYA